MHVRKRSRHATHGQDGGAQWLLCDFRIGDIHARPFCWYSALGSLLPHNTRVLSCNLIGREGLMYSKARLLQQNTNILGTVNTPGMFDAAHATDIATALVFEK